MLSIPDEIYLGYFYGIETSTVKIKQTAKKISRCNKMTTVLFESANNKTAGYLATKFRNPNFTTMARVVAGIESNSGGSRKVPAMTVIRI
jgi:hypothetical protein